MVGGMAAFFFNRRRILAPETDFQSKQIIPVWRNIIILLA